LVAQINTNYTHGVHYTNEIPHTATVVVFSNTFKSILKYSALRTHTKNLGTNLKLE